MFKILITTLILSGCVTVIDTDQWNECWSVCLKNKGLEKAGKSLIGNKCCECGDGRVIDL